MYTTHSMLEITQRPAIITEAPRAPKLINTLNISSEDLRPSDIADMRENLSIERFERVNHPFVKFLSDKEVLAQRAPDFDWQSVQLRGAYLEEFEPLQD